MDFLELFLGEVDYFNIPYIRLRDVLDVLIVAFFFWKIISIIRGTRTWFLFKGILVVLVFAVIASILQLQAVSWIISNTITMGMIAVIILFQPELRRALEQIGNKNLFPTTLLETNNEDPKALSLEEKEMIVDACFEMAKFKTGALIVLEQKCKLHEISKTGIRLNADISKQLLINIFEKNTPLHDGAVVVANRKIISASCFLPLSENPSISRDLGTRHRAALGVSETTDAMVLVVSEETGAVSFIEKGIIHRNLDRKEIMHFLIEEDEVVEKKGKICLFKRKQKNKQ